MSKKQSDVKDLTKIVKEEKDLVTFLNICRQEWRRIHTSEIKKKGRPSQKDLVWTACDNAVKNNKLHTPFTQNKVIDKIKDDVGTISDKTFQNHVKTWINNQILFMPISEITNGRLAKGQLYWLQKNNPKEYNLIMSLKEPEVMEYVRKDLPAYIEKIKKTIKVYEKIASSKMTAKEKRDLEKDVFNISLIQKTIEQYYKTHFLEQM